MLGYSDQPYYSEDKNIALIFNGEFYNFNVYKKDLIKKNINFESDGDTEVLLKLYEKNGIGFLQDKNIDALYSITVHDKKLKKYSLQEIGTGRIPPILPS